MRKIVNKKGIPVNQADDLTVAPTGAGFAWVSGHSYSIEVITARGTQLAFTVVKS